jgi:hypothetical protein
MAAPALAAKRGFGYDLAAMRRFIVSRLAIPVARLKE